MSVDERAGEGVDGKSGPRRRLKVRGVCTAGRYKNLEDGEPIWAENILKNTGNGRLRDSDCYFKGKRADQTCVPKWLDPIPVSTNEYDYGSGHTRESNTRCLGR